MHERISTSREVPTFARRRRPMAFRRRGATARVLHMALAVSLASSLVAPATWCDDDARPDAEANHAAHASFAWPSPLTLEWCLERFERHNPELMRTRADRDMSIARQGHVGRLEDPRFGYEASQIPLGDFNFKSSPMSGQQLTLKQRLPFPGVLGGRRAAARAGTEAAGFGLEATRVTVRSEVEATWSELAFSQRALDVAHDNVELMSQIARLAEQRYATGEGTQADVLRARVQHTQMLDEALLRESQLRAAEARLSALLDAPYTGAVPTTSSAFEPAPLPPLEDLLEGFERTSPELRRLRAKVHEADSAMRAARSEGRPDIDVGLGYRIRQDVVGDPVSGQDFFSAGISMSLPVDRRGWNARTDEARAAKRRAEADYRAALAQIRSRLQIAHASLARADAHERLVRTGLVPQAAQSLESSRSGYRVGRVDLLGLLDSQVTLLEAELQQIRARADRRIAFASLEAAAGRSLR